MKRKMPLIAAILLLVVFAAFWLVSTSRAATETPDYKVIRTDGKFEIRDYPALTVATTPMEAGSADSHTRHREERPCRKGVAHRVAGCPREKGVRESA